MKRPGVLRGILSACIGFGLIAGARAEVLLDETGTVASPSAPSAVVRGVEIFTAGTYELTLTDFAVPAALSGARAALLRDGVIVKQVEFDATASSITNVDATPGNYVLTIVGAPGAAGVGTVGARLRHGTDTPLLELTDTISLPNPPPPANQRTLNATIAITAAGSYRVAASDVGFPNALARLRVTIVPEGGAPVATFEGSGSALFDALPGNYRLFVIADADPAAGAGVFYAEVRRDGASLPIYFTTLTAGAVTQLGGALLPAGLHTLAVTDLALPAALTQLKLALVSNGQLAARLDAPGQIDFTAVAGGYDLFAVATPATGAAGSFAADLHRDGTAVLNFVNTASDGASSGASTLSGTVAAAGTYRLRLTDFAFPQGLSALRAVVTQNGVSKTTLAAPGTVDVDLQAGAVHVLLFAQANQTGNGIYGVELKPATGTGSAIVEGTRGVGTAFASKEFTVSTAGRYQVFADDLEFPERFAGFDAVITRGPDVIGSFFGGGSFIFSATPGNYFINFIVKPGATSNGAGTYRMRVASAPNIPTVSLNADSTRVDSGGTTRLTWSSTDATTCTASGAWSGAKAAIGNEVTIALSTQSTFNLECTGAGGSSSTQLTVDVNAPSSSGGGGGGGGRMSETFLLALLAAAAFRAVTMRARRSLRR